jgi:hypothetical protein
MTPDELAARLEHAAAEIGPKIREAVHTAGELGKAMIQSHASGRPGPNVITGAYRASWTADTVPLPAGAVCTIGTNAPQGRRLEFGFSGPDSLGRVYNQPPFPHVGPAIPYITTTLNIRLHSALAELLS